VEAAYPSASQQVSYQGEALVVSGGDFSALAAHWRLLFKSPTGGRAAALAAIGTDRVIVNESFSLRYRKRPGDVVELPTASGPHAFEVAAVYYDYANSRGVCMMDATVYARHYPYARPNSLAIYLKPEADADDVTARVSQAIGILIGLMLSLVLIYVINVQSFGWTIQFHVPLGFLAQSTLFILLVTALAGLYPAAQAARVDAVRFAREE